MITQECLRLGSRHFIRTLIMTGRWPLLIFRSLGQRSRSQWLEIVKWFPDDNSRTLRPRIMKLHWYIDHDWLMTPTDFQVTRSKVKVTVTRNSNMVTFSCLSDRVHSFHLILFKLVQCLHINEDSNPIDFHVTGSKVKVTVTWNSNMVTFSCLSHLVHTFHPILFKLVQSQCL